MTTHAQFYPQFKEALGRNEPIKMYCPGCYWYYIGFSNVNCVQCGCEKQPIEEYYEQILIGV